MRFTASYKRTREAAWAKGRAYLDDTRPPKKAFGKQTLIPENAHPVKSHQVKPTHPFVTS